MFRLLLVTFCYLTIFQLIAAFPSSVKTREDEAVEAFNNLTSTSHDIMDQIGRELEAISANKNQLLQNYLMETEAYINVVLDDLERKIDVLHSYSVSVKLNDTCTDGFKEYFISPMRSKLPKRAEKCVDIITSLMSDVLAQTHFDILWQYQTVIGCHNKSLTDCRNFAKDDSCYDNVIANIERASQDIVVQYNLIRLTLFTKLEGLNLPCLGIIEFELSTFPERILDLVTSCTENAFKLARPSTCPGQSAKHGTLEFSKKLAN